MEKILVVDDSSSVLIIMAKWLKSAGEVVKAENGKMALPEYHKAHKEGNPFTLAIIDLNMPEMSGEEAINHPHTSARRGL